MHINIVIKKWGTNSKGALAGYVSIQCLLLF